MSGRGGDQIDDDFMTDQGSSSPVLGDMGKHPMLNLVPLASAGREVTNRKAEPEFIGQLLQAELPQAGAIPITASGIGGHDQLGSIGIGGLSHLFPPAAHRLDSET